MTRRISDVDRYYYEEPERKRKKKSGKGCLRFFAVILILTAFVVGAIYGLPRLRMHYQEADTKPYADGDREELVSDKKVLNILLIGADRNSDGSNGRSDTMMLVSVDTENKKIRLVSFMRDMYVDIPTVGQERLNAAFAVGGAGLTVQTVEDHFQIRIDGYVLTNFEDFTHLIDGMGGIDVEITAYEAEFINSQADGFQAEEGANHLSGSEALFFARMRKLDSDFGRTGRQRQVIISVLNALKQQSTVQKAKTVYAYMPYITHDLSSGQLVTLAGVGNSFSDYKIETMNIPQDGTWWDESVTINGIEGNLVLGVDFEANAEALREFLYEDEP